MANEQLSKLINSFQEKIKAIAYSIHDDPSGWTKISVYFDEHWHPYRVQNLNRDFKMGDDYWHSRNVQHLNAKIRNEYASIERFSWGHPNQIQLLLAKIGRKTV